MQLAAGADAEPGKDLTQVPFARSPGQVQLGPRPAQPADRFAVQIVGVGGRADQGRQRASVPSA
jgi:hypothetical protein